MNIDELVPKLEQLIEEGKDYPNINWMLRGENQYKAQKWLTSAELLTKHLDKDIYEKTSRLASGCVRQGGIIADGILGVIGHLESLLQGIKDGIISIEEQTPTALKRIIELCNGFDKVVTDGNNKVENERDVHKLFSSLLSIYFNVHNEIVLPNYPTGRFSRCDIELTDEDILIEIKFTGNRDGNINKSIIEELAIDLQHYSSAKKQFKYIFNFVYDPPCKRGINNPKLFEECTNKEVRTKDCKFKVCTLVRPLIS